MLSQSRHFLPVFALLLALHSCKAMKIEVLSIETKILEENAIGTLKVTNNEGLFNVDMDVSNDIGAPIAIQIKVEPEVGDGYENVKESEHPPTDVKDNNLCASVDNPSDDPGLQQGSYQFSDCDISSLLASFPDGEMTVSGRISSNDKELAVITVDLRTSKM